ncbi:hypothetical protein LPTSP3_g15110 [Leptospira kobayashii]|uniref:Uncharacterized protein n=1 Tax=Leptospira kobayashii TaxID=1917830 RepID=A0ABN6KCT0_9LEPT|nr:hypothetical protein [Leptospira kobayashii]BDA78581.1 hypothetical protein LPTSP3_g15110 [Leptospira kobayashii]
MTTVQKIFNINKLSKSILLIFAVLLLDNILLGENQIKKPKSKAKEHREKPVWNFDCKEKRDCLEKCNNAPVFQMYGPDQQYVNRIKTECFSECSRNVDCNKGYYE